MVTLSILVLVLCASVIMQINAVFQEQKGEHDWTKKMIGAISDSIFIGGKELLCAASSASLLSCLSVSNGEVKWRSILPSGQRILKIVHSEEIIYTLSLQNNDLLHVSAFAASTGGQWWTLGLKSTTPILDISFCDFALHEQLGRLVVLVAGNQLHVLSNIGGGGSKPSHWTWKSSDASVVVSSLIPTLPTDSSISPILDIAIGCVVDSEMLCSKVTLLTADVQKNAITVKTLKINSSPKIPVSNMFSMHPLSESIVGYNVIATKSDGVDVSITTLFKGLTSQTTTTLSLPIKNVYTSTSSTLISSLFNDGYDFSVGGIVSVCGEAVVGKNSNMPTTCFVISAQNAHNDAVPEIVLSCHGATTDASVSYERWSTYDGVSTSVTCAGLGKDGVGLQVSSLTATAAPNSTPSTRLKWYNRISQIEFPHSAFSGIEHVHLAFSLKANSFRKTISLPVQGILQLSSGVTTFVLDTPEKSSQSTIVSTTTNWSREEGFGNIRDMILVDDVSGILPKSKADSMPTFNDRLALQLSGLVDFHFALPSIDTSDLLSLLPTNIAKLIVAQHTGPAKQNVNANRAASLKFGYNKIAVVLAAFGGQNSEAQQAVVYGLNTMTGAVVWSLELTDSKGARVLIGDLPWHIVEVRKASGAKSAQVVVMTNSQDETTIFSWQIDATTGQVSHASADRHTTGANISPGSANNIARRIDGPTVELPHSKLLKVYHTSETGGHIDKEHSYLLLVDDLLKGKKMLVEIPSAQRTSSSPRQANANSNLYVHIIDEKRGALEIFKAVTGAAGDIEATASILFPPSEAICGVVYPSATDVINSRSIVLGDDSVLLKYLNPHFVMIATVSPTAAAAPFYAPEAGSNFNSFTTDASSIVSTLTIYLVDTVSGKIIQKIMHENGAAPFHAVISENNIVATYWNCKVKRTELTSIALFEGLVDKYALNPIASSSASPAIQQIQRNTNFTAYSTVLPLSMQKSYVLPKPIAGMHVTHTSRGIANKNVLLALTSGQLYSLDMRQVHPRRPMGEPTPTEKEEGLMKYHPMVFYNPLSFVTLDEDILGTSLLNPSKVQQRGIHIVSAETRLESTAVVLSHWGLDLHFNIATPSQGFDSLASDFNYVLLVFILSLLGLGVLMLRRSALKKQLNALWA